MLHKTLNVSLWPTDKHHIQCERAKSNKANAVSSTSALKAHFKAQPTYRKKKRKRKKEKAAARLSGQSKFSKPTSCNRELP